MVLGVRRGRSLRHLVTVRTNRSTSRLLTAGGELMVEIADDLVTAVAPGPGSATLSSWREIEAELGPAGSEELLDLVNGQLVAAGARPSEVANKVARAVGGLPVDDGVRAADGTAATAGDLIRGYLAEQDNALVVGDLSLRRGLGGIHPTRVATRRLRSTLRIFADYLDAEAARALDAELSWYADLLGQVRDREVQRARFAATLAELPAELVLGPVAATIEQQLLTEQLQHETTLLKTMNSRRYLNLLRRGAAVGHRSAVHRPGRRTRPPRCGPRFGRPNGRSASTWRRPWPAMMTRNCTRPARPANALGTPQSSPPRSWAARSRSGSNGTSSCRTSWATIRTAWSPPRCCDAWPPARSPTPTRTASPTACCTSRSNAAPNTAVNSPAPGRPDRRPNPVSPARNTGLSSRHR